MWCNWIPHFSNYLFFQSLEGKKLSKTLNWSDPLLSTFFNFLPNIEAEQHMDQLWSTIEISFTLSLLALYRARSFLLFFHIFCYGTAKWMQWSKSDGNNGHQHFSPLYMYVCAVALRVGITMLGLSHNTKTICLLEIFFLLSILTGSPDLFCNGI